MPTPGHPLWTFDLVHTGNRFTVSEWIAATYTQVLTGANSLQLTLDGADPALAHAKKYEADIIPVRLATELDRLRLAVPMNMVADMHAVTLPAFDYRDWLRRRIHHGGTRFNQVAQTTILSDLVAYTQALSGGSMGLTNGTLTAGTPRDRTVEDGQYIGELFDSMADNSGGFDWWTAWNGTTHTVNAVSPRRTRDMTSKVLEWGQNVASWSGAPHYPFRTVHRQAGDETQTVPFTSTGTMGVAGRWEDFESDTDLKVQSTVDSRAAQRVAEGGVARETVTMTLSADVWGTELTLEPGDVVTGYCKRNYYTFDAKLRIHEITFSITPDRGETVSIVALQELP